MRTILAADIGGTSSRFALFCDDANGTVLTRSVRLGTREFPSFAALLEALAGRLAAGAPDAPDAGGADREGPGLGDVALAALAVPAVVSDDGRCVPPNIAWDIDLARDWAPSRLGAAIPLARVRLLNDFEAQAHALRSSRLERAEVLQAGRERPGRVRAVIGAGTGLGHCALVRSGERWLAVPSEAGHGAFPFVGERERDLEHFLLDRFGVDYCWMEHVVSGRGLALVHEYLSGERLAPEELPARLEAHPGTVRRFARFYGRAARQYALQVLAVGGLAVSGGVAERSPCLVRDPAFLEEFRSCPRFEKLLGDVPLRRMRDADTGLYGAARFALQELDALSGAGA